MSNASKSVNSTHAMKRTKILSKWRGRTLNTKIYSHHVLNRRILGLKKGHLQIGLSFSRSRSRYISLSWSTKAGWKVEDQTGLSCCNEWKSLKVLSNQEVTRSPQRMDVLQLTTIQFSPNKKETNGNLVFLDMNRPGIFHRTFLKKNFSLRIEQKKNHMWITENCLCIGYRHLKKSKEWI